jgi:hypothetical protein
MRYVPVEKKKTKQIKDAEREKSPSSTPSDHKSHARKFEASSHLVVSREWEGKKRVKD